MEEGRADVGAAVSGGPACSNSRVAPASPRSTAQVTRSAAARCHSWCPGNPGPCLYKDSPPGQPNSSFCAVQTSLLRQSVFRPVLQSQSGGCCGVFCCCAVAPASPSAKVLEVRKVCRVLHAPLQPAGTQTITIQLDECYFHMSVPICRLPHQLSRPPGLPLSRHRSPTQCRLSAAWRHSKQTWIACYAGCACGARS